MRNITKSQPAPACLALEKIKKNGKYNCGNTFQRLHDDFFGKCYLCEDNTATDLNIEHFKPHFSGKNIDRKFDWKNLFYACSHCNGRKGSLDIPLLDCTNPAHKIVEWIKFDIKPFPKELVKIEALQKTDIVQNTVNLLDDIYNCKARKDVPFSACENAANNLRQKLITEIKKFGDLLEAFYEEDDKEDKDFYSKKIKKHLKNSSPFSAFKLWIVKENDFFRAEFLDS